MKRTLETAPAPCLEVHLDAEPPTYRPPGSSAASSRRGRRVFCRRLVDGEHVPAFRTLKTSAKPWIAGPVEPERAADPHVEQKATDRSVAARDPSNGV